MEKIRAHEVIASEGGIGEEVLELPGFRFHPTDEELVHFYLRRKVNKKAFSLEIIKEIDIYKYDPWDLPKAIAAGEKEWYFFCLRGRKYKNSIRPNRVTGSGFWKATGIDRPIYAGSNTGNCIGLKKSLVYYRGSAGKGTKTDWMMHEFRLPSSTSNTNDILPSMQEAEIWTLCRIFKKDMSYKRYAEKLKESTNRAAVPAESSSKASSGFEFDSSNNLMASCTSNPEHAEMKQLCDHQSYSYDQENKISQVWPYAADKWDLDQYSSVTQAPMTAATLDPNVVATPDINDLFREGNYNWNEIGSIMDLISDHNTVTYDYLYA